MNVTTGANTQSLSLQNSQVASSRDTNIHFTTQVLNRDPYEILEKCAALDALFDSDARYDPPKCHPDTRKAVLDHIRNWANSKNSQPVMWIRGGAGAGKSAIAQTLSEGWDEDGVLAASFYFSRTAPGRNEKKHVISTLAYQISISIPATRPHIEAAIRRAPKLFERNLRTQIKQLIMNPLASIEDSTSLKANIVVIDGLDECCVDVPLQDHEQQQKEILDCIHLALSQHDFPLRFLIASRPERQIREIFEWGLFKSIASRVVLDDTLNPAADIEVYLRCKLAEIRQMHFHLGPSWPSEDIITQLVAKSSGHFIYAAVVIRYLSSPRMDPSTGLDDILNISLDTDKTSPFEELDALYLHILQSVAPKTLPTVMSIFGVMLYSYMGVGPYARGIFEEISWYSPTFIAKYLFLSLEHLYLCLVDLHSILEIPPAEASTTAPITFLHASFSEFLTQISRSRQFFVNKEHAHLHTLSLSVRHLFIQALSPDNGETNGYGYRSFGLQTIKPDDGILEALKALVNQDEDNFVQYVQQAKLNGSSGPRRQTIEAVKWLYDAGAADTPSRPIVLVVLKRHSIAGFTPIDPASFFPEHYEGVLDWFCDGNQQKTAPNVSEQPIEEESGPLDIPLQTNSQELENPTPLQSPDTKPRVGFRSRISSFLSKAKKV